MREAEAGERGGSLKLCIGGPLQGGREGGNHKSMMKGKK